MANRSIVYDQEQLDPFDVLWQYKDFLVAIGALQLDLAGQTTTVVTGFTPTPTGPASLSVNLTSGRIYQQSPLDSTSYGALASDSTIVQQQGNAAAQSVTFSTAGLSSGQSMWALVQAQFSQVDVIRTGDPTGGVLNYWNSANPTQPFQGPNNDGSSQPTERKATVAIQIIYGSPSSTGSEVPPNPTSGWVPLYLVDLAFNQTTIISGQILVAGPSVGANVPSNYPGAPFLSGLFNQHHKGIPGQAPQIDLTTEAKNVLPLANLPASNTSGGGLPVMKRNAGNPNGNVAGNANVNGSDDLCWDFTNNLLYVCTTTGSASTAVWTSVVGSSTNQFAGGTTTGTANAQVVASTTPSGFARSPGQIVTFTVGPGPNTGATTLNVDSTGVAAIQKTSGGGNIPLAGGELTVGEFVSVIWTGTVYLLQSASLGQLATLNIGTWLKNDGSGNLTIKNGANLGDDGSGNLEVLPEFLPAVGVLLPYGGTSAPAGYIMANGQNVSRSGATANLFSVYGITYGSGDGVTTFTVPDGKGRVLAGADGGANRLTSATMSSQFAGGVGGLETETLTLAQTPTNISSAGSNTINASGSNNIVVGNGGLPILTTTTGGTVSTAGALNGGGLEVAALSGSNWAFTTSLTGTNTINVSGVNNIGVTSNNTGGQPHPNVQPTLEVGGFIIKI